MKRIVIYILMLCSLSSLGQIKFSTLSEVEPNDAVRFLVGDEANNARKISYATLKNYLGVKVYPSKVTNVMPSNNALVLRHKIVQTVDSLTYFIDHDGNGVYLGTYAVGGNFVTIVGEQSIAGKKTFSDTTTFNKGLKSSGTIDTKGLNTEGGSGKIAMKTKGIIADADTIVAVNNYLCDGNYGSVGVNTSAGNRIIKLINASSLPYGSINIRKETSDTNTLTIIDMSGNTIYVLYSKLICRIKNNGIQWKKETVSIY